MRVIIIRAIIIWIAATATAAHTPCLAIVIAATVTIPKVHLMIGIKIGFSWRRVPWLSIVIDFGSNPYKFSYTFIEAV